MPLSSAWQWLLLCAVVVAWIAFVFWIYRRDGHSLPKPVSTSLLILRLLAAGTLVFFVLNPEKRSETRIVQPSRVTVLVDTSLSMGLADQGNIDAEEREPQRRIDLVSQLFNDTKFLTALNEKHDLDVYRFGSSNQLEPIAEFPRSQPVPLDAISQNVNSLNAGGSGGDGWKIGRWAAILLLLLAVASIVLSLRFSPLNNTQAADDPTRQRQPFHPTLLLVSVILLGCGLIALAVVDMINLSDTESTNQRFEMDEFDSNQSGDPQNQSAKPSIDQFDWNTALGPSGTSTKIGTALQQVVNRSKGGALAGIVLLSDGGQNDGLPINRAIAEASDANIPIYSIGVGDNRPFTNVRISEINAPTRVTPDDPFNIDAIVQAFGMQNQAVQIQLIASSDDEQAASLLDEQTVTLLGDGVPSSVKFEVQPQSVGTHRFQVRLVQPENDLDATDNVRTTTVQSIDRKTKVFLMAGGPSRDYQFLRNQLFRDDSVQLDILLQTAMPGADQESDEMLFAFPDPKALAEYDCVVAFDPDWRQLDAAQATSLEQWVSNKAGGLIVVAGPVFTPEWTRAARGVEAIDRIRDLYPVSFFSQGSARLKLGRFGGEKPFPLKFSRAGRNARQLWLGNSATENMDRWQQFEGVYGYYAVNEAKAGADILAWFSDTSTAIEGSLPIYLASHYYGSGRVLFQASSEIWRLRSVDVEYFQKYYLNLIRWAAQGRLLRDSNRGVLLLDRDRCWVGDQLVVRAILRDESDQPLMQEQVAVTLQSPGGRMESLRLVNVQDAARPGTFTGSFVTTIEGDYQVALPMPGRGPANGADQSVLRASVQANIPDLEKVRPERNDALLLKLAQQTTGHYFHSVTATGQANWITSKPIDGPAVDGIEELLKPVIDLPSDNGLATLIRPVDQETYLPGLPDDRFAQRLARWLLVLLVTFLCCEWTLRRLHRLA